MLPGPASKGWALLEVTPLLPPPAPALAGSRSSAPCSLTSWTSAAVLALVSMPAPVPTLPLMASTTRAPHLPALPLLPWPLCEVRC